MRNKRLIFVFFVLISIFSLSAVTKELYNIGAIKLKSKNSQKMKIDSELFANENLKVVLDKSYYNYQYPKIFSSVGLVHPYPNQYLYYWTSRLINKLNYEEKYINELRNNFKYLSYSENNLPEYLKLYYEVEPSIEYGDKVISDHFPKILKQFDIENGLFFENSSKDELYEKLSVTLMYIDFFKYFNKDQIYLKKIVSDELISLYNDNTNFQFSEENIDSNSSILIVKGLSQLGYTKADFMNRDDWYVKWKSEMIKRIVDSPNSDEVQVFNIFRLKLLYEVSEFFLDKNGLPVEVNIIADNLLSDIQNNSKSLMSSDPQLLAALQDVQVASTNGEKIDNTAVKMFIKDTIESGFNKFGVTEVNLQDNYFGIAIANKIGFSYDKDEMSKLIRDLFIMNFVEDTSINDHTKLLTIYYLLMSCEELDLNIENPEIIIKSISNYLTKESKRSDFKITITSDVLMSIEIANLLKTELPDEVKKDIKKIIGVINSQHNVIYQTDKSFELYYMIEYIDNKTLLNEYKTKINKTLEDLKYLDGYKSSTKPQNIDSYYASSAAWRLKYNIGEITPDEIDEAKLYNYKMFMKDEYLGIKLSDGGGVDLEKIYKGMNLSEIYTNVY